MRVLAQVSAQTKRQSPVSINSFVRSGSRWHNPYRVHFSQPIELQQIRSRYIMWVHILRQITLYFLPQQSTLKNTNDVHLVDLDLERRDEGPGVRPRSPRCHEDESSSDESFAREESLRSERRFCCDRWSAGGSMTLPDPFLLCEVV